MTLPAQAQMDTAFVSFTKALVHFDAASTPGLEDRLDDLCEIAWGLADSVRDFREAVLEAAGADEVPA